MKMMKRAGTALLIALAACTDAGPRDLAGPEDAKPRLSQITTVNICCSATLYKGASYQVYVNIYDENGQPMYNQNVYWFHDANGVAAIWGSGHNVLVEAVNVGTTNIYASVGGITRSVNLTVIAAPVVTTVQVTPSPATVYTGSTQALTARAYDQYGNQMSGQTATWSTANSGVATVSSSGVVTGVSPDTTTITATIGGKTASVSVTVANAIVLGDIYGPDMILTEDTYTWGLTSVSGGNGTYMYEWQIDWVDTPYEGYVPIDTGATLSRLVTGCDGNFRIGVLVISGAARSWTNYEVENFASGSMCQ